MLLLALATVFINLLDIVAIALLSSIAAIAIGEGTVQAFDWFPQFERNTLIIVTLLTTGVIFGIKTLSGILLTRIRQNFLATLEVHFSNKIARHVFSDGLRAVKKHSRSYFEWSILRSTWTAFGSVVGQSLQLFAEITLALLILGLFFYTDWISALVVLLYFVAVLMLFQVVTKARVSRTGSDYAEGSISVGQAISDSLVAFREISVLNRFEFFMRRISRARAQVAYAQALQLTLQAVPRLIVELSLIVGAIGFAAFQFARSNGEPDIGLISIFIVGSLRMMSALLPLYRAYMQLRYDGPQAQSSQDFMRKAIQRTQPHEHDAPILDTETLRTASTEKTALSVELDDVSFHYRDRGFDEMVVEQVSLAITPGATVAFIGPSGAGKSTLVDLILGLHEPSSGEVRISGMRPRDLRDRVPGILSYVPQKPGLISGTIRENIALGVPENEIDDSQVWNAVRLAQIEDLVTALPGGLDAHVGEQADALSGGQIQRIGLARAMYTRPKLLVLDEATSALDAETEATITDSLSELEDQMTLLVVAHRLSTVQHADTVFVIDEGKIVAAGKLRDLEQDVPLVKKYIALMSFDD